MLFVWGVKYRGEDNRLCLPKPIGCVSANLAAMGKSD